MRRAFILALVAPIALGALGGCKLYFGDGDDTGELPDGTIIRPPDARERFDGALGESCLSPADRSNDCAVDLSGTVTDFASGAPVASASVDVGTAWDTIPPFPAGCDALQSAVTDASGAFRIDDATCDSPLFPPIVIVMVRDVAGERAPTASDARLSCALAPSCDPLVLPVSSPSTTLASRWRDQLQTDGMLNAATRGLVILEYRDPAGAGVAGVVPFVREGTVDRTLAPAREVRFLADDRVTLIRADAAMTGTSGMAIIAYDAASAFVGGRHVNQAWQWQPVGVLFADGWIFLEDRTRDP